MHSRIIFIAALAASLQAQSITRVEYRVIPGNLIEITYTLRDSEPNSVYNVALYASLDGGYSFPVSITSVTGDVGRVLGPGVKSALWKVLDDLPALNSEVFVIKVVGRVRPTWRGIFRSLFVGNRLTKRLSNGLTFYGGQGIGYLYEHSGLQAQLDKELLKPDLDGRAGIRVTAVPFVYRFEASYKRWGLGFDDETIRRLKFLSFGDGRYGAGNLYLHRLGLAFSSSYTLLPVFGLFLPQVGAGAALHQWQLGDQTLTETATLGGFTLFGEASIQFNLLSWLKVNIGARQHFLDENFNQSEVYLDLGLHISL